MTHETQIAVRPELSAHRWPMPFQILGFVGGVAGLSYALRRSANRPLRIAVGAWSGSILIHSIFGMPISHLISLVFTPVITMRKSINVRASAAEIYAFWKDFKNFPKFMGFVHEVSPNAWGGLRWKLKGPAGHVFQWDAWVTALVPNQWLSWRSEKNSILSNEGSVKIHEFATDQCRVDVELSWAPPVGMLGSVIARTLGFDPRQLFESDLAKMKILIESKHILDTNEMDWSNWPADAAK